MYTIGEFAKIINRSVKTLQRWDHEERLKAKRTPTNRRYYTHQQYLEYIGIVAKEEAKNIVYTRVSSSSQKKDLKNQKKSLEIFLCQQTVRTILWTSFRFILKSCKNTNPTLLAS